MDKRDTERLQYTYGPVPSRRLGLSLGVDVVPHKICTLDCVYCQLGQTTDKSIVRRDFVDIGAVLSELRARLEEGIEADYVTIGGSGEPTLHARLGELIVGIHRLTDIPVALLTNGTLLYRPDVRAECANADVVIPSLDAGDQVGFAAVNRPHRDITIEKLVSGLARFRAEFTGQIWLEIFLVPGVNTGIEQVAAIAGHIAQIRPDKVQLNTAVRPSAEKDIRPVAPETLAAIARQIGGNCEVVGDPPAEGRHHRRTERAIVDVLSMLKRRPCSIADVSAGLGMTGDEATRHVACLQEQGLIFSESRGGVLYFRAGPWRP